MAEFDQVDYLEEETQQTAFTTSNPSETDSYCSTIIYNTHHSGMLKSKTNPDDNIEVNKVENYFTNYRSTEKNLSTSSTSPDHGTIDSDNQSSDRDGNISLKKYSSSSSYR